MVKNSLFFDLEKNNNLAGLLSMVLVTIICLRIMPVLS